MIGRRPETQSRRDACGSGLQGIGADPSPAPELSHAFERPKPSSERKHDNDDDVSALPERRRRIWRSPAESKEARNFKDLKGLNCHYTFGIRAPQTLRRFLHHAPDAFWQQMHRVNDRLLQTSIHLPAQRSRLIFDLDSTVVTVFGKQEDAAVG